MPRRSMLDGSLERRFNRSFAPAARQDDEPLGKTWTRTPLKNHSVFDETQEVAGLLGAG